MKIRARAAMVRPVSWNRFSDTHVPDSYKQPSAAPSTAACPVCHAVFLRGHWQWCAVPEGAASLMCSACHRTTDGVPAARLVLDGAFEAAHREEILGLVRHRAQRLHREHPMERVMAITSGEDGTSITTTGMHIARDISSAIHHAYGGKLDIDYAHAEAELHVRWHRS